MLKNASVYLCSFCHFFYFSQTKRKLAGIGDQPETFCLSGLSLVVRQGKQNKANACVYLRMYTCVSVSVHAHTHLWGVVTSLGFFFFPFVMSGPIPPLLSCPGHAPELYYNSNYNSLDSLLSIVLKAAVTEISKFCQQLSSEMMGAEAGMGGVNPDEWGVMQSPKSLNSCKDL